MEIAHRTAVNPIHPVHAVILAGSYPLFLGGLLSDFAYSSNYELQWSNFAAWLIAGAMVFTGLALAWSVIDLVRSGSWRGRALICFVLLAVVFMLGLVNSFVHARDAWATMPLGLILSAVVTILALVATWVGFSTQHSGAAR